MNKKESRGHVVPVSVLALGVGFVLALTGCGRAPAPAAFEKGDAAAAMAYLGDFIEHERKTSRTVGLSVSVADGSGVLWSEGFGFADEENGAPVTPATLFDLASVSKVFTATAVMQMAEDGTIDLDSPVSDYLPEFRPASRFGDTRPITVRNLLTHHSGIQPDWIKGMLYEEPVQSPDLRFTHTAELLRDVDVCWPPEYAWAYSNLEYSLLGAIIDRCSGESFYRYMEDEVLSAVGMEDSTFNLRPETYGAMSKGYAGGKPVPLLAEREVPAGGLASSAGELGLFMASYLNPADTRLLSSAARDRMYVRQNGRVARDLDFAQGIGWVLGDYGFRGVGRVVSHSGGEWSSNTLLTLLPDLDLGIAVLTNSAEGSRITEPITREIIRVAYRLRTGEDPEEYALPPDAATDPDPTLAGSYLYQSLGIVEVYADKGTLWAKNGGMRMKLVPNERGRYRLKAMLLGFVPISVPFLESMEISFAEVDGDMLSGVYQNGAAIPEIGIRIERPALGDLWYGRQGTYELVNADAGEFPVIAPWEFSIEDGFPTISGKLYGDMPFSMVVKPVDDNLTLWAGIGRRSGDTIRFERMGDDTIIRYQGYIYKKSNPDRGNSEPRGGTSS